jgi:hypothetical protein
MNVIRAVQLMALLAQEKHDEVLFQLAHSLFYRRQS